MFMFGVRRFSTKGNLYSTLNEFALFKKKYEEVMPNKTLQIVDMSQGASSTIYYKVEERKTPQRCYDYR